MTETPHMASFIKQRRAALGLSLDAVAKRVGCSKAHIWQLEQGTTDSPSITLALSLCDGLQCSLGELLDMNVSQPRYTDEEKALVEAHRRIFHGRPKTDQCRKCGWSVT